MKLYATTTSERASKGQGGNDFLRSDIYITDRNQPQYRVIVTVEKNGEVVTILESFHFGKWREKFRDVIFTELKGERQKGEHAEA